MYPIQLERTAEKDLRRLGDEIHDRVIVALRGLARDPRPPGARKLAGGSGEWRVRVGDHRIVYDIADVVRVVRVYRVRHRRDVYRG